ncbi:MAG TPA: O-antigen ligase family protein [Blastocatellia bacterium]
MNTTRSEAAKDHLSKTIRVVFLVAVVFTALAHGAVEPWSVFVFEGIIVIILLLWSVKVAADRRLSLNVPSIFFPIVSLIAVALVQSVALTDGSGRWMSLSKNVESTRGAVIVLIFLSISFLIATNFFDTRRRLSGVAQFLVIYGLAMAVFALVQHFTWNGSFYWLRHTEMTSPFGPFANHNHFAGYMELLIPLAVALVLRRAVRPELRMLYGFAAAMMGVAAVLSLSRGGIISVAASMIFLAVMSYRVSRRTEPVGDTRGLPQFVSQSAIVLVIVAVITAGIFWIGADPVINRVTRGQAPAGQTSTESFFSSRGWVWRDTFTMIRANPLLGVGFGAYETAFSMYTKSDGSLRVPQSHNDYLQIVADCGIVGGLIALWFIVLVFRSVVRGARSRDPLVSALALGSGAGLFAMLVHSLFDFNLQVPSNALLFLLLSAVATRAGAFAVDREGSTALRPSRTAARSEKAVALSV